MNWPIASKVVCCEPVAVSPEICVRPLRSPAPDRLKIALNALLRLLPARMPVSIAPATLVWLALAFPGRSGDNSPGASVRNTSPPA